MSFRKDVVKSMPKKDEFQLRREARQKKLRKKRAKRTLIFILFLIVAVSVILCLTVLFPIKKVSASGSKLYSQKQIVNASNLKGKNVLTASEEKTEEILRNTLPYVDSVKFKRKLPDTIDVKVTDAAEYAYYTFKGKFYTVSKKGNVLEEKTAEPLNLLKINCSTVNCAVGEKVKIKSERERKAVNQILKALKAKEINVNAIDVTNSVAIKVRVEGRFDVNLGNKDNLNKKIAHLKGMITSIGDTRKGNIDLSMWSPEKSEGSFTEIRN